MPMMAESENSGTVNTGVVSMNESGAFEIWPEPAASAIPAQSASGTA